MGFPGHISTLLSCKLTTWILSQPAAFKVILWSLTTETSHGRWSSKNDTLPKTNSWPLKMMVSHMNLLFQGSIFRGKLAVSFREGKYGRNSKITLNPRRYPWKTLHHLSWRGLVEGEVIFRSPSKLKTSPALKGRPFKIHRIDVWYIYLHLVELYGKK